MTKNQNFTAGRVGAYKCEAGKEQSILWDGKSAGLGLRATAAGAKSYIFQTKLHSKTLRLTIGDVRTYTISKAQAEANRLKALTDQGIDPRELAKAQKEETRVARMAGCGCICRGCRHHYPYFFYWVLLLRFLKIK